AAAEIAAKAAADAFAANSSLAGAGTAAEIAQKAAGGLHEMNAAVSSALSAILPPPPGSPRPAFTPALEIPRREPTKQASLEIDGVTLPFRMLMPNSDANGERIPQIVVPETDDPNLAMVLRLTIDPSQLEDPDFNLYKKWFGTPTAGTLNKKQTFSLTNLD